MKKKLKKKRHKNYIKWQFKFISNVYVNVCLIVGSSNKIFSQNIKWAKKVMKA